MEPSDSERRREERFPIEAGATVVVNYNGRSVSATTRHQRVRRQFEESVQLAVGDQVACEFKVLHR